MTRNTRIGIVTWFYFANPGTAFQAYALQHYLNNIPNCEAEILSPYNAFFYMRNARIFKYYANGFVIEKCNSLPSLFVFLTRKLYRVFLSIKAFCFCSFQRKTILKYPSRTMSVPLSDKDRFLINNRYDWVVLGSDQIWNFSISSIRWLDYFLLSFVKGPLKGAYAPSLSQEGWPEDYKGRIRDLLVDFSFIGVREKQSIGVVQPLTNVPVHWSLDPVFLLHKTDWIKIAKKPKYKGDYIFEYCIIKSSKLRAVTEKLARETGLPIIEHHGDIRKHISSAKRMPHPSADTWLGYLLNAKYVVTDSFHGSAFCVMMNKDFFTVVTSNGSRIYSMLEVFGLQSRVLADSDGIGFPASIDWDSVNVLLEDRRKESQDWLKYSLGIN